MRTYLSIIFGTFIVTIAGLILVILKISLKDFPILAPTLFYTFFFFACFALFTLLGYFLRRILYPTINKYILYNLSFRQALLLSIFTSLSACFFHLNIFTWWLGLITLIILLFIEIIFTILEK